MTFRETTRLSACTLLVAALFVSACGSSSTPTSPTAATPTAPPILNLTGGWAGSLVATGGRDTPSPATWTATQSGTNSTGVFGLVTPDGARISGTLAGVITGSQVAWTMTFPAGTFTAFGSATCSVTATGTSPSVTASSVVVTLNMTFSAPCMGVITDSATEVDLLTLSK